MERVLGGEDNAMYAAQGVKPWAATQCLATVKNALTELF